MKTLKFLILIFIPALVHAQSIGIRFENNLSWAQIKEKAKNEHKFIFVDCYATWCGPCKEMDVKVYPNDTVGNFMNDKFISVKVQMDQTKNDSKEVMEWYESAKKIQLTYQVNALPTFLFFNSDGEIVHRQAAFQSVQEFVTIAENALNPKTQYYMLLNGYTSGQIDYENLIYLTSIAETYDQNLKNKIVLDYFGRFTDENYNTLFQKDNLTFLKKYYKSLSSSASLFKKIKSNRKLFDSLAIKKGLSDQIINYIVTKEEITTSVAIANKDKTAPDWTQIENNIRANYDDKTAQYNVLSAKTEYLRVHKDYDNYVRCLVKFIETYFKDSQAALYLNNEAFDVFKYSAKKQDLLIALSWVNRALELAKDDPFIAAPAFDTKANILYRLNRCKEAIALEKKAYELDPNKDNLATLKKMEKGVPTW